MFQAADTLFHHQVLAAYVAYRDERNRAQTGCNRVLSAALVFASALYHFREHLPWKMTWEEASQVVVGYPILAEVANASKHGELTHKPPKFIADAACIREVAFITEYEDPEGKFQHAEVRVIARCLDGTSLDLENVLLPALQAWAAYLVGKGLLYETNFQPRPKPGAAFIERAEAQPLAIHAIRELGLEVNLRRLRYRGP